MLEKAGIISRSFSLCLSPNVILPKKAQPGQPQKCLCIDFCALNCLLLLVVKAHSRAQGNLSLVPLPKLKAMLSGSTFYWTVLQDIKILTFTQGAEEFAFVTPIGKFVLAQAPIHFQQLLNKVFKGLPFAFGYLHSILIFSENIEKQFEYLRIIEISRFRMANLTLKINIAFSNASSIILGYI